jgi:hypothetical protein
MSLKIITNNDLKNNKYSEEILIENIDRLFMSTILETQENLSIDFINNYILNEKYCKNRNDNNITLYDILHLQPHYDNKCKN